MRHWLKSRDPVLAVYAILLIVSVGVAGESYRLGLGTLHSPGPGFVYFWTATLLGAMALRRLIVTARADAPPAGPMWAGRQWMRAVAIVAALLVYAVALERAGYVVVTFCFIAFLFWLLWERPRNWLGILGGAALTTAVTFFVFDRWFQLQLPKGLLAL